MGSSTRHAGTCPGIPMTHSTDHDDLDAALRRCGSHWRGAQAHGLLCGRLAVHGAEAAGGWLAQVLESVDPANVLRDECESALEGLFQQTWQQLAERQSEFELLLPDDAEDPEQRTRAIADWCEGFLHGLVSEDHDEAVRKRLASEPLSDLIRDMLEITRATVGEDDDETTESAYAELVEYIRVATQLAYEELAETRTTPVTPGTMGGSSDTIH